MKNIVEIITKPYSKEIYKDLKNKNIYSDKISYLISQRETLNEAMNYEENNEEIKGAKELSIELDKLLKTNPEKLVLYTDYDNDGYSGGFIFLDFVKQKYGVDIDFQINNRFTEGYGVNINVIDKLHEKGYEYIITVDLGISSIEQIKKAKSLGMTVWVTDHHLPKVNDDGEEELPEAEFIVNSQIEGNNYEKGICGAYTIWNVLQYIDKDLADNYIDIVALALLSDNMPMDKGLIRKTVIKGIEKINSGNVSNKFVSKIIDEHKKKNYKKVVDEMDLGFYVVPLINAVGRLDSVSNLMKWTVENKLEKYEFVRDLNEERKKITATFTEEAYKKAEKVVNEGNNIILIEFTNCPEGIIGLIASRICEKYKKPTLVATLDEKGDRYKASGRSKDNYDFSKFFSDEKIKYIINQVKDSDDEDDKENLLKKLRKKKNLTKEENSLVVGGGHKYACGMGFLKKNLKILKDRLKEIEQPENYRVPVEAIIDIDKEISKIKGNVKDKEKIAKKNIKNKFNIEFIEEYKKVMSPFGQKNEEPLFMLIGSIKDMSFMGKEEKHIKFDFNGITCVAFNIEKHIIERPEDFVIMGSFSINEFRGKKTVQFMAKEFIDRNEYKIIN